jgi:glycosyltransferase involved in cell wall biosynthesis
MPSADIVMITFRRPQYVRLSLSALLDRCPPDSRVWVWHNGDHRETLDVVESFRDHPRFFRFHHSAQNVGLHDPINWLWNEAEGDFLSKVDDDSVLEAGWVERLSGALEAYPGFGVLGSWRFLDEDYRDDLARRKMATYSGHTILRNHWVQGSGFLFRREILDAAAGVQRGAKVGTLGPDETFTRWCLRVAKAGYVNGWPFPFVHEDHMDDPRSPNTLYTDDETFRALRPLSAYATGVDTVEAWLEQTRRDAIDVQSASLDLNRYFGWRFRRKNVVRRIRRALTGKAPW